MSNFAKIRITSDSPLGKKVKIEVNGQDLSPCCRYAKLEFAMDELMTLRLDLIVEDLEIDGPGVVEVDRSGDFASGWELVQAVTDSENQPHQWIGSAFRLHEMLARAFERYFR